jgi:predicted nuclease with TOPRIM domain
MNDRKKDGKENDQMLSDPTVLSSIRESMRQERENEERLKKQHAELAATAQQLKARLEKVQSDYERNQEERTRNRHDLCTRTQQAERLIEEIILNNVSFQFEINTYRRLLQSEADRRQPSTISYTPQTLPSSDTTKEIRTITVKKTAQGS